MLIGLSGSSAIAQSDLGLSGARSLPDGTINQVLIRGNASLDTEKILAKLKSRTGRPLDQTQLEADLKALNATKWFSNIRYSVEQRGSGKYDLIFDVEEMPILVKVEFRGRSQISLKQIEETTALKVGARADHLRALQAVEQIKRLYVEKGYELAEVQLIEGGKPGQNRVILQIFEGPKLQITSIQFHGNSFVGDAVLLTKISSKSRLFFLFGRYFRETIEEDARKLREYYQAQGYLEVQVSAVTRPGKSVGDRVLAFEISEGPRYTVRNIVFKGNERIKEADLKTKLALHSNAFYTDAMRDADLKNLQAKYADLGYLFTQILPEPSYTDTRGVIDLVYQIEEGDAYRLGELIVRGNTITKDRVIRREAIMAGILPGEVLNLNRIETFKSRLSNTGLFVTSPDMGNPIDVKVLNRRGPKEPYSDVISSALSAIGQSRFQDVSAELDGKAGVKLAGADAPPAIPGPPSPGTDPLEAVPFPARARNSALKDPAVTPAQVDGIVLPPLNGPPTGNNTNAPAPLPGNMDAVPFGSGGGNAFRPPPNTLPEMPAPSLPELAPNVPVAPGGVGNGNAVGPQILPDIDRVGPSPVPGPNIRREEGGGQKPLGEGEPPGIFPSFPGANMTNVGPDRGEPFPDRSFADLAAQVEEGPTGRFLFGVGATSFGGLNGSLIFHEKNFDITRLPTSWSDIRDFRAFRGGGQDFRVELAPGTLINRAQVSFREPYLFDLPIALNTSAYTTQRLYPDYNEQRTGGRVSLGRQFGTQTYADVAFRMEDVRFYGFDNPAPADYLAASGHTTLATIRPSVRFDNRNSPFLPSKGQYLELAFEQGWGTFTFSKFTAEGRIYQTLWSRPDGSGKHILTTRGYFGISGRDTPVYERFYAGDFRSLRGFQYRGVGPSEFGQQTGGIFTALGSIEYQFPWTANDQFQQVFFCDFGTVESDYKFNDIRVAVGTGARVIIPALGKLPIALDIAFPVNKVSTDRDQVFTFFVGAFW